MGTDCSAFMRLHQIQAKMRSHPSFETRAMDSPKETLPRKVLNFPGRFRIEATRQFHTVQPVFRITHPDRANFQSHDAIEGALQELRNYCHVRTLDLLDFDDFSIDGFFVSPQLAAVYVLYQGSYFRGTFSSPSIAIGRAKQLTAQTSRRAK